MTLRLIGVASLFAILASAAIVGWRLNRAAQQPEPDVTLAVPEQQQPDPLAGLSQKEIRERFLELPKRLAQENKVYKVVGIQLSDSRASPSRAVRSAEEPFDTVSIIPEEDIGCGCCLFDIVCETFGDEDFRLISKMNDLTKITVGRTHVTDDCPALLVSRSSLDSLALPGNPLLTDGVLRRVSFLASLRNLDLSDTAITGEGISQLKVLPRLERLTLAGTQITDATLHELSVLQQLKELNLSRTKITGAGFTQLKSLPALQSLYLEKTQVTSEGLANLPVLPELRVLWLQNTKLTDKQIDSLGRCEKLEEINFNSTSVGDATFASLSPLKNLRVVRAFQTAVSDDALESLANKDFLHTLDVTHSNVLGPGLQHLGNCKELKSLYISRRTNEPVLVDSATAKTLAGLRKLESLEIQLHPTESDPAPSLHLSDFPRLRRLEIACPSQTGSIVLSDLPSLWRLKIHGIRKPDDGFFHDERPLLRPLPQIESVQLTRVGPPEIRLEPVDLLDPSFRMHSVLGVASVVPSDLQLEQMPNLSQLRLSGRITRATNEAFAKTGIRAVCSLDCSDGSSPEAALWFARQFVDSPVEENAGFGPVFHLRIPTFSQPWSQAIAASESNITELRLEMGDVDKDATIDLGGTPHLKRLVLAGMTADQVHVANLASSLERIHLEKADLGTLTVENGFAQIWCHELRGFQKLVVTSPRSDDGWLRLNMSDSTDPREPYVYAPREVVLNDLGDDVENITFDKKMRVRRIAINGEYPSLKYVWKIPESTQSIKRNGEEVDAIWVPGGNMKWRE